MTFLVPKIGELGNDVKAVETSVVKKEDEKVTIPIGKAKTETETVEKETVSEKDAVMSDMGFTKTAKATEVTETAKAAKAAKAAEVSEVEQQKATKPAVEVNDQGRPKADINEVNEKIQFKDNNNYLKTPRILTDKDAYNKAVEEKKQAFLQRGKADGTKVNEKEAEKLAKDAVKNDKFEEKFYSTRTYTDKAEYEAAEKDRDYHKRYLGYKFAKEQKDAKAERKELEKQYKKDGLTKQDAKQKAAEEIQKKYGADVFKKPSKRAEEKLVKNEFLKNKEAREYIQNHQEEFLDKNGKLDQGKYKKFVLDLMNSSTDKDEATNFHLSLKERRKEAGKLGMKDDAVCDMINRAGGGFERDYTEVAQYTALAVLTGAGAGIGAVITTSTSSAATSLSASGATAIVSGVSGAGANATASGAGSAGTKIRHAGTGAGIGATIGALLMPHIKDPGGKETKVYDPAPEKQEEPVKKEPVKEEPIKKEPVKEEKEDCPGEVIESNYCDHGLKKGETWFNTLQGMVTVNNKKPEGDILTALVHAEKIKHNVSFSKNSLPYGKYTDENGNEKEGYYIRVYDDFTDLLENPEIMKLYPELAILKDAKVKIVDCEGKEIKKVNKGKGGKNFKASKAAPQDPNKYYQDCKGTSRIK